MKSYLLDICLGLKKRNAEAVRQDVLVLWCSGTIFILQPLIFEPLWFLV